MDIDVASVASGALSLVALAYPPAAPAIAIVTKVLPWVIAAAPVVKAAVKEGAPALEAAQKAAPELTQAIRELAAHLPSAATSQEAHTENVARQIFGFRHMTAAEEREWMDRSTSQPGYGQA